jgi:hypothetical protein
MINFIINPDRFRVDTEIKIIEKDGSELIIPVMIIVKADKLNEIQQSYLHRVVYNLFNKRFIVNKQPKLPIEKPWWKFW